MLVVWLLLFMTSRGMDFKEIKVFVYVVLYLVSVYSPVRYGL